MGESISEFMKRRGREVSRFGRKAEVAAHEAYNRAIRAGQDLKLSSPGEVVRHGARLLQEKADRARAAMSNATRETKRQADEVLRRAGRNPAIRSAGIEVAREAGNVAGVVRGGVHAVQGLANGAAFAGRLVNPFDPLISPRGESAAEQLSRGLVDAGRGAVDYVREGVADPQSVVGDIKEVGWQWRRDLDPSATPAAPTFAGELRRNFDIGQNQGEVAFDVGSLVVGGPAAKAAGKLGAFSKTATAEKYLAQGLSPKVAAYLAEPYPSSGMGHHFILRSFELPEILGGGRLPRSYSDGPFNKLAPEGISRGDMYELHYKVDPRFHAARLPAKVGGRAWRGKAVGLQRHGLPGRLWHGSPAPLKARVGGLGANAGAAMYAVGDEEAGW